MQMLLDDDDVKVTIFEDGRQSDITVLAFTGVGFGLGGLQKEEFTKSLLNAAVVHESIYIVDKKRSWYNGNHEKIMAALAPRLAGRRVVTLGNSMGGYGAILFGQLLPSCQSVIAFCPQFSVYPGVVPQDDRWDEWTVHIERHAFESCIVRPPLTCDTFVFFGADDEIDGAQLAHFRKVEDGRLHLYAVPGCKHDAAAYLRSRGALHRLIGAILAGDQAKLRVGAILEEVATDASGAASAR